MVRNGWLLYPIPKRTVHRVLRLILIALIAGVFRPPATYALAASDTTDIMMPSGANYDTAAFRLWYPSGVTAVRGIVILVPGSGDDGRPWVDDPFWQSFATRHHFALVGCFLTDKPHPLDFVEEYIKVSEGSGQTFLNALTELAKRSKHPEIAEAPLLLWGMSAGGEFNYEFTAWKPERVIAFVVNKGGIYYSALVSAAARAVPGLLFTGGKDLLFRTQTITGLFSINRRAGALWALTDEPNVGHSVAQSRALSAIFFDDMLSLRLPDSSSASRPGASLKPLTEQSGFLGDLTAKTVAPLGNSRVPNYPTAWLPTERVARAWHTVVTGAALPESP